MSFNCECGWVTASGDRTAIEIHKLTHVIINMANSLNKIGLIPEQKETDTHSV